jgi:hypothetical protein
MYTAGFPVENPFRRAEARHRFAGKRCGLGLENSTDCGRRIREMENARPILNGTGGYSGWSSSKRNFSLRY